MYNIFILKISHLEHQQEGGKKKLYTRMVQDVFQQNKRLCSDY